MFNVKSINKLLSLSNETKLAKAVLYFYKKFITPPLNRKCHSFLNLKVYFVIIYRMMFVNITTLFFILHVIFKSNNKTLNFRENKYTKEHNNFFFEIKKKNQ